MKGREITKSGKAVKIAAYIGAGGGLVLFAIIGLLPSSFLGGIIGIKIAGGLFGFPLTSNILPRLIVALSMLLSILVSGSVFVAGGTITGWSIGKMTTAVTSAEWSPVHAYFTGRRNAKRVKRENTGKQDSD